MTFLAKAQMSAAQRLQAAAKNEAAAADESTSANDTPGDADFLSVILRARQLAVKVPQSDVWGSVVVDD